MSKQSKLLGIILIILLLVGGKKLIFTKEIYQGQIAAPVQTDIKDSKKISLKGKKGLVYLLPRAEYELTGVVKSKKKYSDFPSQVSKYDLAIAWGDLNKKEIDSSIRYSQFGRWYRYRYDADTPVTGDYISKHSANVHIIHKNKRVLRQIKKVKKGDYISLKGFLVDVDFQNPNVSLWETSRTRDDTGNGACEILYVEDVSLSLD